MNLNFRKLSVVILVVAIFLSIPAISNAKKYKVDFCYLGVDSPFENNHGERIYLETDIGKYSGKKSGYKWSDGREWYVKPKWYDVRDFSEGRGAVAKKYGKWGFVDTLGVEIIKPQFCTTKDFHCGRAAVKLKKDNNWGYIDSVGNMVIMPNLREADDFINGMASVCNDKGEWGVIDRNGNWLTEAYPFEMHLSVLNDSTYLYKTPMGIILSHQKEKIDILTDCSRIKQFCEGLAAAKSVKNGLWGFINEIGEWVIEPQFAGAGDFNENAVFVAKHDGFVRVPEFDNSHEYRDLIVKLEQKNNPLSVGELNINKNACFSEGLSFFIQYEAKGKFSGEGVGIIDKNAKRIQRGLDIVKKQWEDFWGNQLYKYEFPALISRAYSFDGGIAYVTTPEEKGAIKHPSLYKWTFDDFVKNTIGSEDDFISQRGYKPLDDSYKDEYSKETQEKFEQWAKKGEFEKTEDWENRTSPANREAKLRELREVEHNSVDSKSAEVAEYNRKQQFLYFRLKKTYRERYKDICQSYSKWMYHRFNDQKIELLDYDADKELFGLQTERNGRFSVNVPIAEAKKFKETWFAATAPEDMYMQLNEKRGVKFDWIILGSETEILTAGNLTVQGYTVLGPNGEEPEPFEEEDIMHGRYADNSL